MSETVWHLLKTTCYGPLAIHTMCKYDFICATLYNFFVLVHNTSENTILFWQLFDLQRTLFEQCVFSLKKTKKKESPLSSPLWWGAYSHRGCLRCLQEDHIDSGSDYTSGSLLADRRPSRLQCGRWRGGQRSPPGQPHHSTSDWL